MNTFNEKKTRFFSSINEGHINFAKWVVEAYSPSQLQELFVGGEHQKEVEKLSVADNESIRDAVALLEHNARNQESRDVFELISSMLASLEGFKDIQTPLLNSELRRYLKAALAMLNENRNLTAITNLIMAVDVDYEKKKEAESAYAKNKRTFVAAAKDTMAIRIDKSPEKPKKSVNFAETDTVRMFKKDSAAVEDEKNVESTQSQPKKSSLKTRYENAYTYIKENEHEVVRQTSKHGYSGVQTREEYCRLLDEHDNHVDFFKNGSAKTSDFYCDGAPEYVARDMLSALLSMIEVYSSLAKKQGIDKTLPNGEILNPVFECTEENEKTKIIKGLILKNLRHELISAGYDEIRDRISFDGELLFASRNEKGKEELNEPAQIRFAR